MQRGCVKTLSRPAPLIVAHEVTNNGSDRAQLSPMARAARDSMGKRRLKAIADRG